MNRPWGAYLLAACIGYVVLHIIAAVLGIEPARFFETLAYLAGVAFAAVIGLGLLLQITRR